MKIFLRLGILIFAVALISFFISKNVPEITPDSFINIQTPKSTVKAMVADTDASREQGLSDRESLPSDSGMLFVFPNEGVYGFWMKDMHFGLDIVWIDSQKKVIGIAENVLPETYPNTVFPPAPIMYVLEINAGKSADFGLENGSLLQF